MIERATPQEVKVARELYADDDINIDDDAAVSRTDDGAWVQAWVFISKPEETQ